MSERESGGGGSPEAASGAAGAGGGGAGGGDGGVLHPRSFKLRFAAVREQGRSYVSPVKPLGLPATVSGKFYARKEGESAAEVEGVERALLRIKRMFNEGPRERLPEPGTSAHVYGWWWQRASPPTRDRRLDHRIRDSAWLKSRIAVLAADDKLKIK